VAKVTLVPDALCQPTHRQSGKATRNCHPSQIAPKRKLPEIGPNNR
jgi:hypothetical protein